MWPPGSIAGFAAVSFQQDGVDRKHCLCFLRSLSHRCACVFPCQSPYCPPPTNSLPTHAPCLPPVGWLIGDLKRTLGLEFSIAEWDGKMSIWYNWGRKCSQQAFYSLKIMFTSLIFNSLFYIGVQPINDVVLVFCYTYVIQLYIYMFLFSPKLLSHPGCHITLSRVPCTIQ